MSKTFVVLAAGIIIGNLMMVAIKDFVLPASAQPGGVFQIASGSNADAFIVDTVTGKVSMCQANQSVCMPVGVAFH